MKRAIALAALALPLLSGCGEKAQAPYFQVLGEAKIEKRPALFRIGVRVEERNKGQQESLAAAAKKLEGIREAMSKLDGLEKLTIRTGDADTRAVRPRGCDPERDYSEKPYPENCEPIEFISAILLVLEGEPAKAAGAAVSLLTELGAEHADLIGFDVRDPLAAEQEARNRAVRNATDAARAMAGEAGARLGRPLEIRYGEESDRNAFRLGELPDVEGATEDTIVVTGSRIPLHAMWLPPDVVTFQAQVAIKFALEKPQNR